MSSGDIHVYPANDTFEHEIEGDWCPCCPHVGQEPGADSAVILHHAFDGRAEDVRPLGMDRWEHEGPPPRRYA